MGEYMLPVPATALLAYADAYGWRGENRYVLIEVLRHADAAFLDQVNTKGKGRKSARKKEIH